MHDSLPVSHQRLGELVHISPALVALHTDGRPEDSHVAHYRSMSNRDGIECLLIGATARDVPLRVTASSSAR